MSQTSEETTEHVKQRVRLAVTTLNPKRREREGEKEGGRKCMEAALPVETCPLRFFGNRQCTFETVPIEAGQNSCSWNFYKLAVREQEEENWVKILRRGICRILPIFPAGFLHSDLWVLIYLKDKSFKEIHQKDSTGRERTKNIWKNEGCDVMLEAVLDTAWGKILMSAFGTCTFRKFKTVEFNR